MTAIDRQQIIEDLARAWTDSAEGAQMWDGWADHVDHCPEGDACDSVILHDIVADARYGATAVLPVIVAAVLKPIRELHYPADNDAARTPRCPECLGKAGVHPCGCWADEDQQPVCGHCYWLRSVREPWPCPTVRLLDQIEADCKGGE